METRTLHVYKVIVEGDTLYHIRQNELPEELVDDLFKHDNFDDMRDGGWELMVKETMQKNVCNWIDMWNDGRVVVHTGIVA